MAERGGGGRLATAGMPSFVQGSPVMRLRRPQAERTDLIATVLPPVFLLFHFFHVLQVGSILFSNELRSVGLGRWVGFASLITWYVLAVASTIRTGTIPIPIALLSMVTTSVFLFSILPNMTVAAWRLHGTWLGIAAADSLVCYAVQEHRKIRVAASCCAIVLVYGVAVYNVNGWSLLQTPQFVSTAANMPAVAIALLGIGSITRSAMKAKTDAEAALAVARERNRFHRLIHDAALQPLEALAGGWDVDIDAVRDNARQQAVLLRTALREESGLDDLVLNERLRTLAAQWRTRGLDVECLLDAPDTLLAPTVAAAIAGAAGEALANVAKHAGSKAASLSSWIRVDRLHVAVRDEGHGFDEIVNPAGLGISLSIRERLHEVGGTVDVRSEPGHGTTVTMSVPC